MEYVLLQKSSCNLLRYSVSIVLAILLVGKNHHVCNLLGLLGIPFQENFPFGRNDSKWYTSYFCVLNVTQGNWGYEDDFVHFFRHVEDIHQETLGRCLSLRYNENVFFAFPQTSYMIIMFPSVNGL